MRLTRRVALLSAAAALPRIGRAQSAADTRPRITVAVQRIATSNTLDIMNEASNVGTRHFNLYKEMLIDTNWTGDLSLPPGPAQSWTRIGRRLISHNVAPLSAARWKSSGVTTRR